VLTGTLVLGALAYRHMPGPGVAGPAPIANQEVEVEL
jgi:hypothetical protein